MKPYGQRSPAVMKPRGQRRSAFQLGLAAFLAGLAMSFLVTHASAQDDACVNKCGTDADCVVNDFGAGVCQCKDGSTFNDVDYTCDGVVDECVNKCGTDANCVVAADGTGECECVDGSTFNDVDNTCDGVVVDECGNKCGTGAKCVVNAFGAGVCKCKDGFTFNKLKNTCNRDLCAGWDCGTSGCVCQVIDGVPECVCFHGLVFNEFDQTCYGPYLQTMVQLQLQVQMNGRQRSYAENVNFTTDVPAEQASGTIVCTDLSSSFSLRGDTRISVGWTSFQSSGKGNGMCKSVSFHAKPGCTDKPGLTIPRPAKDGQSYRNSERTVKATNLPRSVGCQITTCHKDCGAADCVVKDGKPRCECPWGFEFKEAEKNCSKKIVELADNPCKTGTLRCDKNSTCVVKNGQGRCQCKAGYTKTSDVCTGEEVEKVKR
ncbi:unnamed protein product [Closterium sp. Yama58-4]|nr:unnamed protein product [Closterium sp. Yama58-4]